jgi:PAS domain S-box-containing protein
MTARIEARGSLDGFFSLSPTLICILDTDGRFLRVNGEWERLIGAPSTQLHDRQLCEYLHPGDQELVQRVFATHRNGEDSLTFETRWRCPDLTHRWLSWNTAYFPEEDVVYAMVQDRTEARVSLRVATRKVRVLRRVNAQLERFAILIAHELQDPLRSMTRQIQLVAARREPCLDPEGQEFLRLAVDGAGQMERLIRDLLTYSRITKNAPQTEAVDCAALVAEVAAGLWPSILDSRAVLSYGPLPTVRGYPWQLKVLFQNLISNAIKFQGDAPPCIDISATVASCQSTFCIRDNGIGIAEEDLRRCFQMFQRLHGGGHRAGNGVGLAICKRIVERHGGCIWVDSLPGRGSSFYFTVPTRAAIAA